MSLNSLRPIVAICGTTGVGKSKLAIELALHLNAAGPQSHWRGAKVINADAMQVYEGLDLITNKVPVSERQGIEHLMMGFKKPGEQYVVGEWVKDTLSLIDELHKEHQIPIIVGGTSYWIQHLMLPNRLVTTDPASVDAETPRRTTDLDSWPEDLQQSISKLPPELLDLLRDLPQEPPSAKLDPDAAFQMHTLLSLLDPVIARRWHWKDTRKVLRSLEIMHETRRRASDIVHGQSQDDSTGTPRYRTLCFWLYAKNYALHPRLDSRVDDMLAQGLLDEVRQLNTLAHNATNSPSTEEQLIDFTTGIYQSIGYREFCSYLEGPSDTKYKDAVERMKISTRQYAKRQISWIRNKLLPAVTAANTTQNLVPFYLLDATELGGSWETNVQTPATGILDAFLCDGDLIDPRSLSETAAEMLVVNSKAVDPKAVLQARQRRVCEVCTLEPERPITIEEGEQWDNHINSKNHRRLVAKARREKEGREIAKS